MSRWALNQCESGNDTEEMRNLITNDWDMIVYYTLIKEDEIMLSKIKDKTILKYYKLISRYKSKKLQTKMKLTKRK